MSAPTLFLDKTDQWLVADTALPTYLVPEHSKGLTELYDYVKQNITKPIQQSDVSIATASSVLASPQQPPNAPPPSPSATATGMEVTEGHTDVEMPISVVCDASEHHTDCKDQLEILAGYPACAVQVHDYSKVDVCCAYAPNCQNAITKLTVCRSLFCNVVMFAVPMCSSCYEQYMLYSAKASEPN